LKINSQVRLLYIKTKHVNETFLEWNEGPFFINLPKVWILCKFVWWETTPLHFLLFASAPSHYLSFSLFLSRSFPYCYTNFTKLISMFPFLFCSFHFIIFLPTQFHFFLLLSTPIHSSIASHSCIQYTTNFHFVPLISILQGRS